MRYKFVTTFIISLIFIFSNLSSPFARTVTVSWNHNTEDDLAGYMLFVGRSSAEYGEPYMVGKVEEYQLELPDDGNDHYLALKAYDYSGNESDFSQEVVVAAGTTPSTDYSGNESDFSQEVVVAAGTTPSTASAVDSMSLYPFVHHEVDDVCLKSPCAGYIRYITGKVGNEVLSGAAPASGVKTLKLVLLSRYGNTPAGNFRLFISPGTTSVTVSISSDGYPELGCRFNNHEVTRIARYVTLEEDDLDFHPGDSGWLYIENRNAVALRKVSVTITIDLAEFIAWYNGSEVKWDINGDPWSADNGVEAARVCTASDLDACRTEYECVNVDANWYGGACNAEASCTAGDLSPCDDDRTRCANSGFYWYDDFCNQDAACTVDDLYACDSRDRCEGSGFYWDGDSCQAQSPCQRGVLSACSSREDCQVGGGFWYNGECRRSLPTSSGGSSYSGSGSGGSSYSPPSSGTSSSGSSSSGSASFSGLGSIFSMQTPCGPDNPDGCDQGACEELGAGYWWYDGACRPGQQIETYGNDGSRIAEAQVRLGDDADDGTISAGEGMSIHLDVPANVSTYALLVFPDGEYFFLDNNDYFTKRVVPVTSGVLPVTDNLCAVLEELPGLMGEWGVAFLTVPTTVGQFQSLNDIVDYINNGGTYHFGSYGVMVDCQ